MPLTRTIPLTELVPLFRQMPDRSWQGGSLCGTLTLSDDASVALMRELRSEEQADNYPIDVEEGDDEHIELGSEFKLRFGDIRTGVGKLVPNIPALLKGINFAANGEPNWYLVDRNEASWEDSGEVVCRMSIIRRLVRALEGLSSVIDVSKQVVIFLRKGRLDVPLHLSAEVFLAFDKQAASELINLLTLEDGNSKQRHEICATVICELLEKHPKSDRFDMLLKQLEECVKRFNEGYRLFAASFSFERIRDQAEAIKLEYLGKIHKTISDIQGQLLGIPISTIVIATQFKDVGTQQDLAVRAAQTWVNVAVLVGAAIFCIFLSLAVWNQKHTLDVLKGEIDRHKNSLQKDYAEISGQLDGVFVTLSKRARYHRIGLYIVLIVCWLAFAFGAYVFWRLTRAGL